MIIQTAPDGEPRHAIMMHEHTALAGQFARAFGNAEFEPIEPADPVIYVIAHHDAGWAEFDRNPTIDEATGLPHNLVETPIESLTRTSRLSPDFNERHHAYCGLISSMHSWGLYNGRYGLSNLVLIDRIPAADRHFADEMLQGELGRQVRLKAALAVDPQASTWLDEPHLFQNYKQLQFCDTLALYFNRIHEAARGEQAFEHVPVTASRDVTVTIRPRAGAVYELSPYPFIADGAEFAFARRPLTPRSPGAGVDWPAILRQTPTTWDRFRLVAGRT